MDNKVFNVNGVTKVHLEKALELLLFDGYEKQKKVVGWCFDLQKGFILIWSLNGENAFPTPLYYHDIVGMIWEWLKGPDALSMKCEGFDADVQHDGSNERAWRVYVEGWGKIDTTDGKTHYTLGAIRPSYAWYGK